MSGKLIGIIVAVLIVVGGGAAFVITQNKDDKTSNSTTSSSTSDPKEEKQANDSVNGSLFSIADGGKARKCTFSSTVDNVTSNGTIYTDGKGRGFSEIVIPNVGSTNVLVLSDKVYGWTNAGGSTTGFILNKAELQKVASTNGQTASSASSANKDFALKCSVWSVDTAQLTVPTNINFRELPTTQ